MRRSLAACLLLPLPFAPMLMAAEATDDQVWNEMKFTSRLGPHFDAIGAGSLRFTDDASRLGRFSLLAGANWHATERFTLTPTYSYIAHEPIDAPHNHEHRLALTAALRVPLERCEITLAGTVEYRIRESHDDGWRLRPKVKIKRPFAPDAWKVTAYVADEQFFDTLGGDWTTNRVFIGIERKMKRDWVLDFYYAHAHDLLGRNPDLNILGVSMRFSFDGSAEDSRVDLASQ